MRINLIKEGPFSYQNCFFPTKIINKYRDLSSVIWISNQLTFVISNLTASNLFALEYSDESPRAKDLDTFQFELDLSILHPSSHQIFLFYQDTSKPSFNFSCSWFMLYLFVSTVDFTPEIGLEIHFDDIQSYRKSR